MLIALQLWYLVISFGLDIYVGCVSLICCFAFSGGWLVWLIVLVYFDSLVLSWFARGDVCGCLVCLGGLWSWLLLWFDLSVVCG